jgi:hypothetical protein
LASGFHWVCEKKSWGGFVVGKKRGEERERERGKRRGESCCCCCCDAVSTDARRRRRSTGTVGMWRLSYVVGISTRS